MNVSFAQWISFANVLAQIQMPVSKPSIWFNLSCSLVQIAVFTLNNNHIVRLRNMLGSLFITHLNS